MEMVRTKNQPNRLIDKQIMEQTKETNVIMLLSIQVKNGDVEPL